MRVHRWLAAALCLLCAAGCAAQQMADPKFDAKVANPAYASEHPRVVIDEAHRNFHTASGRYKPLAELLRSDGYDVVPGTKAFSSETLKSARVLVVANALGPGANAGTNTSPPAFTQAECDAVREWVRGGGSLLLISDHTPFGAAAEMLGRAIGVEMGKGFVYSEDDKYREAGEPTRLLFSRENGLLGDHAITRGRNDAERVNRIVAFTGQSVSVPEGATALMRLSPDAAEVSTRRELASVMRVNANVEVPFPPAQPKRATGAQGVAMTLGKGRVVVLGEAAMMSAQVVRFPNGNEFAMGMNAPGNDDRQFALNVLRWLTGLLN